MAAGWLPGLRGIRDGDPRRLRALLALLFCALAIPTGAVIWQAWGQLEFEAFYQYRNQAEALVERIDAALGEDIGREEARRFTDFSFLNVAGEPSANVLQRSPLAAYPVAADVAGVVGYFQVGADGEFSTPLLPDPGTAPQRVGVPAVEFASRLELASRIRQILADNRLVRDRSASGGRAGVAEGPAVGPGGAPAPQAAGDSPATLPSTAGLAADNAAAELEELEADLPAFADDALSPERARRDDAYSQQVFDMLNRPAREAASPAGRQEAVADVAAAPAAAKRGNSLGKLEDLGLDEDLQKKSEAVERRLDEAAAGAEQQSKRAAPVRARRVEQATVPGSAAASPPGASAPAGADSRQRIETFESEVDPYEFSPLDSGHLVLFRKVWRGGERYIQGLLIDRDRFLRDAIETAYRATPLSGMTDLVVGYRDDVVTVMRGGRERSYSSGRGDLQGTLLYRASLSAPFEDIELVFSSNRLPPGPGASVLAWTTVVIAVVFVAGFLALYRLGMGQIRLARQQQDFVSAVSHELKTPLTSIRMYGEMLREGWVDESKRRQYYDYIHDESERLTRLISNVLQLARITRNEPQVDLRATTVGELLDQVRSKIGDAVSRAGFELTFERDEKCDGTTIDADADCFAQIVINLVDNAMKFSRDADTKRIDIGSALTHDGRVTIRVRDYGPGVPNEQMKKIFGLFYRSESELTRETVGTGIGLAIVHQLTLAMSGTVDVINRDPGAEFRLSFPVSG